jgi:hypothetical protein
VLGEHVPVFYFKRLADSEWHGPSRLFGLLGRFLSSV